jgi:hypothetical protein
VWAFVRTDPSAVGNGSTLGTWSLDIGKPNRAACSRRMHLPCYAALPGADCQGYPRRVSLRIVTLPEDESLESVYQFFAERDFNVVVHQEPRREPTTEEWLRMSSTVRAAWKQSRYSWWADLQRMGTSNVVRWYGGGKTREAAVRRARARWRVEEGE